MSKWLPRRFADQVFAPPSLAPCLHPALRSSIHGAPSSSSSSSSSVVRPASDASGCCSPTSRNASSTGMTSCGSASSGSPSSSPSSSPVLVPSPSRSNRCSQPSRCCRGSDGGGACASPRPASEPQHIIRGFDSCAHAQGSLPAQASNPHQHQEQQQTYTASCPSATEWESAMVAPAMAGTAPPPARPTPRPPRSALTQQLAAAAAAAAQLQHQLDVLQRLQQRHQPQPMGRPAFRAAWPLAAGCTAQGCATFASAEPSAVAAMLQQQRQQQLGQQGLHALACCRPAAPAPYGNLAALACVPLLPRIHTVKLAAAAAC